MSPGPLLQISKQKLPITNINFKIMFGRDENTLNQSHWNWRLTTTSLEGAVRRRKYILILDIIEVKHVSTQRHTFHLRSSLFLRTRFNCVAGGLN